MLIWIRIFIISISVVLFVPLSGKAQPETINIGIISSIYEPMKFSHDKHTAIESNCALCHHHSEKGATPTCASCHSGGDQRAKKKTVTGLKDAYHGLCIGCHKKMSGPVECAGCHSKKNKKLDIMYLKTISKIYEPVKFTHGKHIGIANDCALCHHHSEGNKIPACKNCHEASLIYQYKGPDRKSGLGLKGAYHGLCVSCHKKSSGPKECNECHEKKTAKR